MKNGCVWMVARFEILGSLLVNGFANAGLVRTDGMSARRWNGNFMARGW